MMRLPQSLLAWGTPDFSDVLKREIEQASAGLPLQQGLSKGSHALDDRVEVMIIGVDDGATYICVRAGLFYSSIIAGCSCADDPTPADTQDEYCEVRLEIDKLTGETAVVLLAA